MPKRRELHQFCVLLIVNRLPRDLIGIRVERIHFINNSSGSRVSSRDYRDFRRGIGRGRRIKLQAFQGFRTLYALSSRERGLDLRLRNTSLEGGHYCVR